MGGLFTNPGDAEIAHRNNNVDQSALDNPSPTHQLPPQPPPQESSSFDLASVGVHLPSTSAAVVVVAASSSSHRGPYDDRV